MLNDGRQSHCYGFLQYERLFYPTT
jgi:hypothetical protein